MGIIEHENMIRLSVFLSVLALMLAMESLFPQRARAQTRLRRWPTNIALIVLGTLLMRLVIPVLAVGTAQLAEAQSLGLLAVLDLPWWLRFALGLLLLDMCIYWQHVASHHFTALWAIHRVHHADRDIDVTTGLRFHPAEIILSMLFKLGCILVIGAPAAAVIVFEVVLNGCAMFNHANIRMPATLDRALRYFLVTPNMHRIHHSVLEEETNSNYGFSISLWDRLFGSYRDQPSRGYTGMTIGLREYQNEQPSVLWWTLRLPFLRAAVESPAGDQKNNPS